MSDPVQERAVNIGPRQRLLRRVVGIICLAGGVGLTVLLVVGGQPRLLRLVSFGLFLPGILNLLQDRERT
jgi:hypothetical protein